jgi:hypothetical protein
MVDAVVGAVIMVVATTSLLFAIEVAEQAFDQAGRYPLNDEERTVLEQAGLSADDVQNFWQENVLKAPREVGPFE